MLVVVVIGFVTSSAHGFQAAQAVPLSNPNSQANPLDQLSSADVAESIANVDNLPEATAVRNQAESVNAELAITPAENVITAKTQVVATALKSRQDIQSYVVKQGDSLQSLAAQFNVTSNSILWSNNLVSGNLNPGTKLVIPPINGLVYTVKAGDTAQSLAQKYGANAAQITAFNDAELTGLIPGEQIVIPNGQPQQTQGGPSSYNFYATYGFNGYDFGFCTWYVASQIAVPTNWGNASSWAYYASLSGWSVSSTPTVGAIAQTPYAAGGEGHVGIVVAVNGNSVEVRDMNNYGDGGGWDRVGESWGSASTYPNYITH